MHRQTRLSRFVAHVGAMVSVCLGCAGATGAGLPELVLGNSTALTGPSAELGLRMNLGLRAAFAEANNAGGIGGRKIRFVEMDDGYEPARVGPNMRKLTADSQVLAIVGSVGTPTAVVSVSIANAAGVPFVGAYTGAGVLRQTPADPYVINLRASYAEETGAMVDALIDHAGLRPEEVAFFTQRDAYGDAGFNGGLAALKRRGLRDESSIAHGRYERNTVAVENALADVLNAAVAPRAVIMVGSYAPCARFITLASENGLNAILLNVSFVGTESLIEAAGPAAEGVIITQVVPHPESEVPAAVAFRAALNVADETRAHTRSFTAFEGYLVGKLVVRALAGAGAEPSRESLLAAFRSLGEFDLGMGVPLRLDAEHSQACHTVWPTIVRAGRAVPVAWESLRGARRAEVK